MKTNQTDDVHRNKLKKIQYYYYPLFLLFGIGTWLNLNGIWIELPLLIPRLPEGWKLSAQLGMASNLANIGPLFIALVRQLTNKSSAYEVPSICVIFCVGILVPLILVNTWSMNIHLLGSQRSIYLLVFGFFLALVNCTSSVTYLPFVNRFDSKWLNIYFGGESLSSFIPAILGLIQGVGEPGICVPKSVNSSEMTEQLSSPRFSVEIYLICLSILMMISFISFLILWRKQLKMKKKIKLSQKSTEKQDEILLSTSIDKKKTNENEMKFDFHSQIYLFIVFWTSLLLFGVIPSINSYSLNPYGAQTFHLVIILCQCCYPLVSLVSSLFPNYFLASKLTIFPSIIAGTITFIYIIITASLSPCSPFVDQHFGKYIIAINWLLTYIIIYYVRISLGNYFNQKFGHRGLFWYGLLTQLGAFIGATVIFILTLESIDLFKERLACQDYQC